MRHSNLPECWTSWTPPGVLSLKPNKLLLLLLAIWFFSAEFFPSRRQGLRKQKDTQPVSNFPTQTSKVIATKKDEDCPRESDTSKTFCIK